MLALLRKDFLWFLVITIGFLSSAVLYSSGSTDGGATDSRVVFQIGILQIGLVCFSVFASELRESYRFLQTLPVSVSEIVVSKFSLVLAQVVVYWCVVLVLLSNADWPASDFSFAVGVVNTCATLSLLLAAFWYWGIFGFGFSRASKILSIFCFGALIGLILLAETFEDSLAEGHVISLSQGEWIFVFVLALAAYYLIMLLAIRTKIAREVDR